MAKFSEISLDSFGLVEIEKLVPPKETLDKLVKEFQGDLRGENKNNLKFIKYVVSLIKKDNLKLPVLPKIANKILELSYD